MVEPPELQKNRHWRTAVTSMRVGFVALAVVVAGVIVLASTGTPVVLVIGVVGWVIAGAITVTGMVRAHADLPEPRPGLWPLRFMLLRDVFRRA